MKKVIKFLKCKVCCNKWFVAFFVGLPMIDFIVDQLIKHPVFGVLFLLGFPYFINILYRWGVDSYTSPNIFILPDSEDMKYQKEYCRMPDRMWFYLSVAAVLIFLILSLFFPSIGKTHYLPAVTEQQVSIATMGNLNKDRYKDGFSVDVMFLTMKPTSFETKLVGIGSIQKKGEAGGVGSLNLFILQPIGAFLKGKVPMPTNQKPIENILDRVSVIAGGGMDTGFSFSGGGGVQIDLDHAIGFFKHLGRDQKRAGIVFPFYKRTWHAGIIYENEYEQHRAGVVFGFSTDFNQVSNLKLQGENNETINNYNLNKPYGGLL